MNILNTSNICPNALKPCSCWRSGVCNNIYYNYNKIMKVTKSNWTIEDYSIDKLQEFYKRVSHWYNVKCPFSQLKESRENKLIDWIKTEDITRMVEKSALDLISIKTPEWANIAWRMKMRSLYKRASRNKWITNNELYSSDYFIELIKEYTDRNLYHKIILEKYTEDELRKAASFLDKSIDDGYIYTTVQMYEKRYLINRDWIIRELPQHMYLVIALFLMVNEDKDKRLRLAKEAYLATAKWEISLPTPNLLNARTPNPQLSSCFILDVDDDLRWIYHSIENMAQISKNWWWIWVYLWNVRAKWSSIKWVYWLSGWVSPWVKVINDTWVAVNQMWKRAWAISVTLDVWHKDIYSFLDLQTETWDIRGKSFDIFPAVSIPDLFMRRVENNEDWTLFCPYEVKEKTWIVLQDLWWEEFEKAFKQLENTPNLRLKETVKAKELFKTFLKTAVETWMPYTFFRDTVNKLNPNKDKWVIHCSNLCTEIAQNQSATVFKEEVRTKDWNIIIEHIPGDTVICNLASVNIAKVNKEKDIARIIPIISRLLDNVIELNRYPTEETRISAEKYRAIWIWYMWVAQYLAENKMTYWSEDAINNLDELFKLFAKYTLSASAGLAKERWAYPAFNWSEFSKWIAYWETISSLFGKELEDKVKEWVRFWYHTAPAPNTSTALVVWTTAWVVPVYKKFFTETNAIAPMINVAPWLSEDNFWYYTEYTNADLWKVIDTVAAIQKWVDQSVSFEWLFNPQKTSPADLYWYWFRWWKKWLKTVYYVRSLSLDVWDACESCSG